MKMGAIIAPLRFRPMLPGDAVLLDMQPSQQLELGLDHSSYTIEEGEELASDVEAWTAYRGSRIVGIAGFRELLIAGSGEAIAWATFSADVGSDHLALTRFARQRIATAPFRRIVAIVDVEQARARLWASMVGLVAVHTFTGAIDGKTYALFERVKP